MHPRIRELLDHLRISHQALSAAVESVPAARRGERPAPGRWSVTEVLQHLTIVNHRIAANISNRAAMARSNGAGPDDDSTPVLPTFDVAGVADRSTKVVAPPTLEPQEVLNEAAARDRLEVSHQALREAVRASDGVDLGRLTTRHPLFGEMNLYHWIAFAGAHEVRHAAQIVEVRSALR